MTGSRKSTRRDFLKKTGLAFSLFATGGLRCLASSADGPRRTPTLDFLAGRVPLKLRGAWTDVAPRPWLLRPAAAFTRITVHHRGGPPSTATAEGEVIRQLDGVLTSHRNRGYGDVGYHFIIDYAGRVWEGRSLSYEGAHVSGENQRNLGIMVLGNYEDQACSNGESRALSRLVLALGEHFGIRRRHVYGHRDLGSSLCPGRHLYRQVKALRA
jgi:hypothetical protein